MQQEQFAEAVPPLQTSIVRGRVVCSTIASSGWSKDDAPAFFGQQTRYGHRVYGAVILNVVR